MIMEWREVWVMNMEWMEYGNGIAYSETYGTKDGKMGNGWGMNMEWMRYDGV